MTLTELNEIKENYKVLEIAVDFINPSYNISRAKRLDTARYILCTLTENGIPRTVKVNESARIRLQKPDRTFVYNDCAVLEDGRVFITLTEQILAVEGNAVCDIQLTNEDTGVIYSTKTFIINIDKTAVDNSVMESTDEFNALNNLIATNKKLNDELETNETERIENEIIRQDHETIRNNAEVIRITNENERISNEDGRIIAENTRQSNETIRQTQEADRQTNTAAAIANAEAAAKNANDSADDLQTKLESHHFVLTEEKDTANGVPCLDANSKIPIAELYEATTTSKGITQLTDSVTSTSTTTAATPNSVKNAYDKAVSVGANANSYTDTKIADLINGAPTTLDTLGEIADAMADNQSVVEALNAAIGNKVDKADGMGLSANNYTTAEKTKLSGIDDGAEVNQNAFSNIIIDTTSIAANSETDTFTIVAGDNIILTPDVTKRKITISSTASTDATSGVTSISTGTVNGTISVNTNGTAANIAVCGLENAAYKTTRTASGLTHSQWVNDTDDAEYVPDMAFIAHWNGAYSSNGSSNLTYCNQGAFGTIVTKSSADYAVADHTHNYLPLSGGTITGTIQSSVTTNTFLAGNQGTAIISSTATAGTYTMLAKMNSTNGFFTHGVYQTKYLLQYTSASTVTAGTNNVTLTATLLDENGNTSFPGAVTATEFLGTLSGNASTATTAAKLGTATVGASAKPIYLNAGIPTAISSTIGSSTLPVYLDGGTLTACGTSLAVSVTGSSASATYATYTRLITTNPTTGTTYFLPFTVGITNDTNYALRGNNGIRYLTLEGTNSVNGYGCIVLGNATTSGTAGNKYGIVRMYAQSTAYYTQIQANGATSANRVITLPDASGTVALTSNLSSYLPLAGGTMTGTITSRSINPSAHVTYTLGTATNAYLEICSRYYRVKGNDTYNYCSMYVDTFGTTSTKGIGHLTLGNNTASGTAGNAYGRLRVYGPGTGYTDVMMPAGTSTNYTLYLPMTDGTLTTSDIRAKENISYLSDITDIRAMYMKFRPVRYKYKKDMCEMHYDNKWCFGFVAQEVDKILPHEEYAILDVTEKYACRAGYFDNILGLDKEEIIALNTYMIQNHENDIETIKQQLKEAQEEIAGLKSQLAERNETWH